jgi:hypothetical protein
MYEDQLEGISNYLQWKVRISAIPRESKLWSFFTTIVVVPTIDPISLDVHEGKKAKAPRLICDGVKDSLIHT